LAADTTYMINVSGFKDVNGKYSNAVHEHVQNQRNTVTTGPTANGDAGLWDDRRVVDNAVVFTFSGPINPQTGE